MDTLKSQGELYLGKLARIGRHQARRSSRHNPWRPLQSLAECQRAEVTGGIPSPLLFTPTPYRTLSFRGEAWLHCDATLTFTVKADLNQACFSYNIKLLHLQDKVLLGKFLCCTLELL